VQKAPYTDVDGIRARVRQECTEQGVLENVEDPAIIMAAPGETRPRRLLELGDVRG
jgi:hypothetical protein